MALRSRHMGSGGRRVLRHPRSADAARRWCGRTPTHGWLFNASGSPVSPLFGGEDFVSAATAPTYAAASPYPHGLAVQLSGGGSQNAIEINDPTVFDDDGATAQAWLLHARFGQATTNRAIFGKAADNVVYWYVRIESNGTVRILADDDTTVAAVALTGDHQDLDTFLWVSFDWPADLIRIATRLDSTTVSIGSLTSLANLGDFRVGRNEFPVNSAAMDAYALYRYSGADAAGDPADMFARIQRYQGGM